MPRRSRRKSRKSRRGRRKRKTARRRKSRKGKRKMNGYFKLMLAAKRSGKKEFRYKGKRYVAKKLKTGMVVFKKA
jgi:hypothetical protein